MKNITKIGKLYTHCKECNKKLVRDSIEGICLKCKVFKFDKNHKQSKTLGDIYD